MDAAGYMAAAFITVWIALPGYLLWVVLKRRRLRREIAALEHPGAPAGQDVSTRTAEPPP